jgi:L-iditol 2-dehydrogenase
VKAGDIVVIFGAGPVGLLAAQWARIQGAAHVLIVDTNSARLPYAEQLGFTNLCNPRETDVSRQVYALNSLGADVVIEASGASESLEAGIRCARSFGRIVLLGIPEGDATISPGAYAIMLRKELRVQGAWNSVYARLPGNEWALVLAAMASGRLRAAPLISHRCAYDALIPLLGEIHDGATPFMKVLLTW